MRAALQRIPLPAVIVAVVSVAVYANSLLNGFALDDNSIIVANPHVRSPESLADIWLTPYWPASGAELGLYRPGIIFLYALQWAIGDGRPWIFHAVNVALHAGVAVLVFILLRRLAGSAGAFAGALIFAVHPVHTEAVANVVGQAELVAALAVLAACVIHSGRSQELALSWWRRIAIAVLFAIALTTKESSVVLPGLLVLVDVAQRRMRLTLRGLADYADAMLMPIFLLAATLAFYLVVRYDVMGGTLIGLDAAPSMPYLREEHRVLNALRVFPEFIRLLFLPIDLAADYSPAAILPVDTVRPMVLLGAVLLAGLTMLSLLTPWLPRAGFPAAWFLISIVTVSNLFFPIGVLIAERTLYLPSVAVSALVAFAWQVASGRVSRTGRRTALVLLPLVILGLGVRTWVRNPVWASTDTVWSSMLRDQPESYRTQWLYAVRLWRENRMQEAAERFELAYRLYQRDGQLLTEYGNFMMATGRFAEAVPLMEAAHEMHPWILRTTTTLMHAYLATGRYRDAIRSADLAMRNGASPVSTLPVRAFAHQQLGDLPRAIGAWRVAVAHTPAEFWPLHGFLARARAAAGLDEAALAGLDSARAVLPDSAAAAVLDSVERAVNNGCYRSALVADSTPLPPGRPLGVDCDSLGHWFEYIRQGQNANVSQNATRPSPAGPATPAANPP